jgi:beta-glucosidase
MDPRTFPAGFLWGASTSSYQIEGGNESADWTEWSRKTGLVVAGDACDSWNRFRDDVDLAADLGLNAYRISIEWSRVEPHPGEFDESALEHYAKWLAYARARGLKTLLVLWHFTNPAWLSEMGSWESPEAPKRFETYVRRVVGAVGEHVDFWATVNEANTFARHGWIVGIWPPGRKLDYPGGFRVYDHLAEGHRRARRVIKEVLGQDTPVGLTHVFPWIHRAGGVGWTAGPCMAYWNWLSNTRFLSRVEGEFDWLGVQYYGDVPCKTFGYDLDDGDKPLTDMGWRIAPEGLYHVVLDAARTYGVPIIVTENGLADRSDSRRATFLLDHLSWLKRAIDEGADVRGYLHWSLLDNYEWIHGFEPRFGLCEVDYATQERRPRESARLFGRIARENALP